MSKAQGEAAGSVPWSTKIGYVGTGIVIGLVIYPVVRKTLTKLQPRLDEILDALTGKAEGFAEMASDLMAKARESLKKEDEAKPHVHGPDCTHS